MKKINRFTTAALALAMCASMAAPIYAADVTVSGGGGETPVTVTAEATTFSVVVPTSLPVNVDDKGVITYATDVNIINNSYGAVEVKNVAIAGASDWAIVDFGTDMKSEKVNSHKLGFKIGTTVDKTQAGAIDKAIETVDGGFGPGTVAWGQIDGTLTDGVKLPIKYEAALPAQTVAINGDTVANVTFTIEWAQNA